ncbi:775_t:CDS:1 [Gigaspora margarita]|uniref:775_t:CDS:1 n=1 Tax=Gigaspora margarita TaxID=4874 RepID=A0ABM8W4G1_GIGMA|nr:775_t:CDS:1 [Gigaspora margarita]
MSLKFKVPETNSSMQIRANKPIKRRSKENEIPTMSPQSKYVFVSQQPEESSANQTIIENDHSGQQSQVYNVQQFEISQAVNQDQSIIKNTQYIQPLDLSRQQSQVYNRQQIETNQDLQLQTDQTLIQDTQYTQYTQLNQLLDQSGQHLQDHSIQLFETNRNFQIQEDYQNQTMIRNAQYTYLLNQSRQQSQVHDFQLFEPNRTVNQDQEMIQDIQDIQDIQQSLNQSGQRSQVHNLQEFETNLDTQLQEFETNLDPQLQALEQQFIRLNIPVENFAGLNFPVQNLLGNLVGLNVLENSVEICFLPMENCYSPQLQEVNQDQSIIQDIQNNPPLDQNFVG